MLDYTHLHALLVVEREGSFEAAAKVLGMSPIGVATRIRKLEDRMGVKLLTRKPTRPTKAGDVLCAYAAKVASLEDDFISAQTRNALQPSDAHQKLRIAVSDESQLPWLSNIYDMRFGDKKQPRLLDIAFIDQDQTVQHMRNGDLIAALSSHRQPVHAFKSHLLGTIEYLAVASPAFIEEWLSNGADLSTLTNTPCVRRSDDDELCFQWLQQCFGETVALNCFRMPNLKNLIEHTLNGIGWAVIPRHLIERECQSGDLCKLVPNTTISKELYWHVAGIMVEELNPITRSIRDAFSASLK